MSRLVLDRPEVVLSVIWDVLTESPEERAEAARQGMIRARFMERYLPGTVVGLEMDGRIVGGVHALGREVHIAFAREVRSRWFRWLRPIAAIIFTRHGRELVARVGKGNATARRFIEQIGGTLRDEGARHVDYDITQEGIRL